MSTHDETLTTSAAVLMGAPQVATPEPVLIDKPGLYRMGIPFCNAHLLKLERQGLFPKRLTLGTKTVFWMLDEVRAFIAERASERARDESLALRRNTIQPGTSSSVAARAARRASAPDAA